MWGCLTNKTAEVATAVVGPKGVSCGSTARVCVILFSAIWRRGRLFHQLIDILIHKLLCHVEMSGNFGKDLTVVADSERRGARNKCRLRTT